jgi:hypothetical protein
MAATRAAVWRLDSSLCLCACGAYAQIQTNIMDGVDPVTQRGVQPGGERCAGC